MNVYDRQLENDWRILHHLGLMLQREDHVTRPVKVACAWCDREHGLTPSPDMDQTHGICPKHHAGIKAHLEELRRIERE